MSRKTSIVPVAFAAAWLLAAAGGAAALTITRTYVGPGQVFPEFGGTAGGAPSNAVGGGNLIDVFNAAADWWELAIGDTHSVEVMFGWEPLGGSTLAVTTQYISPQPPLIGMTVFDNDTSSNYYLDALPRDNREYAAYAEHSADLGGGVVNTGREYTSPSGPAAGNVDLFSVVMHEIGHLLGLNGLWSGHSVRITSPLPYAGSRVPVTNDGHLNISTALMYPYISTDVRRVTSAVDILVGAEVAGFVDVDLSPAFPFVLYGDVSGDGFVGQGDLNIVLKEWGQHAPLSDPRADVTGDGFVGQGDLNAVLSYWGESAPPQGAGSVPAPEPGTLVLLLAGLLAIPTRRLLNTRGGRGLRYPCDGR